MTNAPSDGSYEIDCHAVALDLREAMTKTEAVSDAEWQKRAESLAESIHTDQDEVRAATKLTDAWHGVTIANGREILEFARSYALSRRAANSAGGVEVKAHVGRCGYPDCGGECVGCEQGDAERARLTPSPTLEPTDAEVERAMDAFVRADEYLSLAGRPMIEVTDARKRLRAALIASRQSTSGEGV